jgi:hypothetical protein
MEAVVEAINSLKAMAKATDRAAMASSSLEATTKVLDIPSNSNRHTAIINR